MSHDYSLSDSKNINKITSQSAIPITLCTSVIYYSSLLLVTNIISSVDAL